MTRVTGWLSPAAALWCQTLDRFDQIYPAVRIELHQSNADEPDQESKAVDAGAP